VKVGGSLVWMIRCLELYYARASTVSTAQREATRHGVPVVPSQRTLGHQLEMSTRRKVQNRQAVSPK
jgi:hypothetical protein